MASHDDDCLTSLYLRLFDGHGHHILRTMVFSRFLANGARFLRSKQTEIIKTDKSRT
jgi:hypothetical protein